MTRVRMALPDFFDRMVVIDGVRVRVSPQETQLAAVLLASPPDRFVDLETLIEAIWPNPDLSPDWPNKCIDRHLSNLRLRGVPLENEWGFGWRIPEHARGGPAASPRHELDRAA